MRWTPRRSRARREIDEGTKARLIAGETVTLSESERALLALPYWRTAYADGADGTPPGITHYTTTLGPEPHHLSAVRPTEHPDGLLGKPCAVCGYKYGSAWLREELPAEVVAEILSWCAPCADPSAHAPSDPE